MNKKRLTDEELRDRAKERCRWWHRKMTLERRCHWCGQPSASDYANACEEHKEISRATTKKAKSKEKRERRHWGLCENCGKRKARFGFTTCHLCGRRKAEYNRRRREAISVVVFDSIINRNLVTVSQVADMVGVHRTEIHRLIKLGILSVHKRLMNKFWLSEPIVNSFIRMRTVKMLNIAKCEKCGHEWWLRKRNGYQKRCPIVGCRSLKVLRYKSSDIKPKELAPLDKVGKR